MSRIPPPGPGAPSAGFRPPARPPAARRLRRMAGRGIGHRMRRGAACCHAICLALLAALLPAPGPAAPDGSDPRPVAAICDTVAARVARESGVPLDVMRAITRTETGRSLDGGFLPWPWTINMEGKGLWFDGPAEAVAYAEREHARGARSFDMGCFQINFRWHGEHFASLDEMMDPLANARYAARFLSELHAETGDWQKAAGRYHSLTPKYAERYSARFARHRASLPPMPAPVRLAALGPGGGTAPRVPQALQTLPVTAGAVQVIQPGAAGGLLTAGRPFLP